MQQAIAIDLGGTTAKVAFMNDNNIFHEFSVPTVIGQVLENLYDCILKECNKLDIDYDHFQFIGSTICGIFNPDTGLLIFSSNLQLTNYPLVSKFKQIFFKDEIYILNDGKAATYGEWIHGAGKGFNNLFLYTIGTGVGGGLIVNGQLINGVNSKLASEPGHGGGFQNKYQCKCGALGCIEEMSSARGIERLLSERAGTASGPLKEMAVNSSKITIKDVSYLVQQKDKEVVNIFREALEPLAKHISVLYHCLDLEMFIIGGGPSNLEDSLIDILYELCQPYILTSFRPHFKITVAKLKNKAGILGAYEYANSQYSKKNTL